MSLLGKWLSRSGREQRAVLRALTELSEGRLPVRLESELTGVSFFTLVSVRKNGVVIARPRSLRGGLPKGSFVRVTLPSHGRKQVRMSVLVPNLKLPMSVKYATICALPESFSGVCQRAADRFNTTRFRNLHLQIPAAHKSFRVVDLSTLGMRILTEGETRLNLFEPGSDVAPGFLRVGTSAQIELEGLLPRSQSAKSVGLEIKVKRDGISGRVLLKLLNHLQEHELQRLHIETA